MPDDKKKDYSWIDEIGKETEADPKQRKTVDITLDELFSTEKSILPKDYDWNQLPEGNTPSADLEAIKAYLSPDASAERTTDQDIEYVKELAKDRVLAIQEKNITKVRELEVIMLAITPDDRTAIAAQDNNSIDMLFENIQRDGTLSSGGIASSSAQKTAVESMFEDATDTKTLFKTDLDEIRGFFLFPEPKNDADTQTGKNYLNSLAEDLYWASKNNNFQLAQDIKEQMESIKNKDANLKLEFLSLTGGVNFNFGVDSKEKDGTTIAAVTSEEIADAEKEKSLDILKNQKEFLESHIKALGAIEGFSDEQKAVTRSFSENKLGRINNAIETITAEKIKEKDLEALQKWRIEAYQAEKYQLAVDITEMMKDTGAKPETHSAMIEEFNKIRSQDKEATVYSRKEIDDNIAKLTDDNAAKESLEKLRGIRDGISAHIANLKLENDRFGDNHAFITSVSEGKLKNIIDAIEEAEKKEVAKAILGGISGLAERAQEGVAKIADNTLNAAEKVKQFAEAADKKLLENAMQSAQKTKEKVSEIISSLPVMKEEALDALKIKAGEPDKEKADVAAPVEAKKTKVELSALIADLEKDLKKSKPSNLVFSGDITPKIIEAVGSLDGEKGISAEDKKSFLNAAMAQGLAFSSQAIEKLKSTNTTSVGSEVPPVNIPVESITKPAEATIDTKKLEAITDSFRNRATPVTDGKPAVFSSDIKANKEAIAQLDGVVGISQVEIEAVRGAATKANLQFSASADELLKSYVVPNNKSGDTSQRR